MTTSLRAVLRADPRFAPALREMDRSVRGKLFLVGGCLRDAQLGRPITDIDLVLESSALAHARSFARAVRGAFVLLNAEEGAGRVVVRRTFTFDFSPCRGATVEEDLAHRDFTVNAMACRLVDVLDGVPVLLDPFRGRDDLRKRRLVAVSEQAFVDDPLRLLRAFRFAARLHLAMGRRTAGWIKRHAARLHAVAGERIRDELAYLLEHPEAAPWVTRMQQYGLLHAVFPETAGLSTRLLISVEPWLADPSRLPLTALRPPLTRMLRHRITGGRTWPWIVRLATVLLGERPARPANAGRLLQGVAERLKLSNRERLALKRLMRLPRVALTLSGRTRGRDAALYALTKEGGEDTPGVVLLALAYCALYAEEHRHALPLLSRLLWLDARRQAVHAQPRLVTGHDLMRRFALSPGPRLGVLLSRLEEARALELIHSKDDAFEAVRAWLQEQPA